MIKSEFDPYSNLTYVYLDKFNNAFCIERGKYVKQRSLSEAIENISTRADEQISEAIQANAIEIFNKADEQINHLDFLSAKMELCFIPYKDN